VTNSVRIESKQIGQLRIYVPRGERRSGKGFWSLFSRRIYFELVRAAKAEGIVNAAAHSTHFGYTRSGRIQAEGGVEMPNPHLSMCVELIDERSRLEDFCRKHSDVLNGKLLVYKQLEVWELNEGEGKINSVH